MEKTVYETKAGAPDLYNQIDEMKEAFEVFKETNNTRLEEVEQRGTSDVVAEEKLARIDAALDALARKSSRPPIGGKSVSSGVLLQHKAAFDGYIRQGECGSLRQLEGKALSVGSDPDGGYLVPAETETMVNSALRDISPIRAIAGIRQVSGSVYKKPLRSRDPIQGGWVKPRHGRRRRHRRLLN